MASSRGRGTSLTRPAWMRESLNTAPFASGVYTNPNHQTVSEEKGAGDKSVLVDYPPPSGPSDLIGNDPTRAIGNQVSSNTPVIDDWVPARAPNGATYWYSRSTRATTWTDPQSTASDERRSIPGSADAKEPRPTYLSPTFVPVVGAIQAPTTNASPVKVETLPDVEPPPSADVMMSPAQKSTLASTFVSMENSAPVSTAHRTNLDSGPATEPLSTSWRSVRTADGRIYYHDRVSNRTQWEKPADFSNYEKPFSETVKPTDAKRAMDSAVSGKPDASSVLTNSPLPTPTDMEVGIGGGTGTDFATNAAEPLSVGSSLPEGWSQYRTPDGRAYYYNARTRETRWNPPTLLGPGVSIATVSTSVVNSTTAALPSTPHLKRSAPDQSSELQGDVFDAWISHLTPQGRQYYYNPRTQATSWSLPPGASIAPSALSPSSALPSTQVGDDARSPRHKQARVESPVHTPGQTKRKVGPARRPRDAEDNPMTDRAAEAYFLKRAKILQTSLSDGGDFVMQNEVRGEGGLGSVATETLAGNTQSFYSMLEEAGITAETPWLDVMARCAGDQRYINLKKYGLRKDAWHKYQAKYERLNRRAAILDSRERAARLIQCLEEHVVDVDDRVLTLHHCPPRVVQDVEEDPRFQELSDPARASLVNVFFARRARISAALRARRRKDVLVQMVDALEQRIDPVLKAPVRGNDEETVFKDKNDSKDNGIARSESDEKIGGDGDETVKGDNGMMDDEKINESTRNGHDKTPVPQGPFFTERTAYRELDKFLQGIDGYGDVSSDDVSDVIRRWQRRVDILCEERAARERETRKAKLRENRAKFRHGILNLILHGRVPFTARWKEVSDLISEEDFAKPDVELGSRPSDLFEDGLRLFEERVQKRRDEFKRILKEGGLEVNNQTTLDSLSASPTIKSFLDGMEKSIAQALLVDRQRKENKRRMKEREKLASEFRQVVVSSDLLPDSTFEGCVGQWTDLSVYKQLVGLGAHDTMRRVFDEHLRLRRSKDDRDRRLKRKLDLDGMSTGTSLGITPGNFHSTANAPVAPGMGGMSGISRASGIDGLPGVSEHGVDLTALTSPRFASHGRIKRMRVSGIGAMDGSPFPGAPSRDEETGWAAVVSEKQLTNEQKAADRERLKQEILKSVDTGKTTHSRV